MGCEMDTLLARVAGTGASDLHISEGEEPVVRFSGELLPLRRFVILPGQPEGLPLSGKDAPAERQDFAAADPELFLSGAADSLIRALDPVLPQRHRSLLEKEGECDFAYALPSGQRFRFNLYRCSGKLSAAIRIIPEKVPSCRELGLPESVRNLSGLKSGLVLITGITGSGKTTTLAALLNEINHNRAVHIVTLEDPVEYRFSPALCLIHQREIGSDTASFASGLRAALREDSDIIMVGELRDLETTAVAVTAAETGHLVFSTLHTRSAAETVNRMVDVFPENQQRQIRTQLAGSLQAVISQQLLADKQGKRTAAFEVMIMTPALRSLIREGKTQQMDSYIQTGAQYGMQTLEDAVAKLKQEGRL